MSRFAALIQHLYFKFKASNSTAYTLMQSVHPYLGQGMAAAVPIVSVQGSFETPVKYIVFSTTVVCLDSFSA